MNDPAAARFGSFFNRIEIEREALKIVNGSAVAIPRLHGLTAAAIQSWVAECTVRRPLDPAFNNVVQLLQRLSERIDALADQSRVVFAGEQRAILPTRGLLQDLADACMR